MKMVIWLPTCGLYRLELLMPRQNRVTPFSALLATPARGTLMGNRGCLHDQHGQIKRQFQGQRWIICLLQFKQRWRAVMTPGQYTELFFLDEATAFAAGHRPCAECQRERFTLFRTLWAQANPDLAGSPKPAATVIDAALHHERMVGQRETPRYCSALHDLPDGTFVTADEQHAYLLFKQQLLGWTPAGYTMPVDVIPPFPVRILTPTSLVRTLAAGYPVAIHRTAAYGANT